MGMTVAFMADQCICVSNTDFRKKLATFRPLGLKGRATLSAANTQQFKRARASGVVVRSFME
jgi:hypothetical protein